jgi:hypothetical protein
MPTLNPASAQKLGAFTIEGSSLVQLAEQLVLIADESHAEEAAFSFKYLDHASILDGEYFVELNLVVKKYPEITDDVANSVDVSE